jgi:hypothetical protein
MRRTRQPDLALPIAIIAAALILMLGPLLVFGVIYAIQRHEIRQAETEAHAAIDRMVREFDQSEPANLHITPKPPPRDATAIRMAATACRRHQATLDAESATVRNIETTWYVSGSATATDGRSVLAAIELEEMDAGRWHLVELRLDGQYVE